MSDENREGFRITSFTLGKGFKTGDVTHRVSRDRPKHAVAEQMPTMVAGKTSKFCPHCVSIRVRRFERSLPMTFEECERHRIVFDERVYGYKLPYRQPRVSTKDRWWNIWPLYLLIMPLPNAKFYFCWEVATCKKCGTTEKVMENCYYRQFGLLREGLFVVSDSCVQLFVDIRHMVMPNR